MKTTSKVKEIADVYSSYQGLNGYMIKCVFDQFVPYIGHSVLEIGPADGYMTKLIQDRFQLSSHTLIEASSKYVNLLKKRYPQCSVYHHVYGDKPFPGMFDTIILSHVLEHVPKPQSVLKQIPHNLESGGHLLLSVPNGRSIHRLLGVALGYLDSPTSLNEQDQKIGHYRVYDPKTFREEIEKSGLKIIQLFTSFFKPLSNYQMENLIPKKDWVGYYQVGKEISNMGADIIAIAEKR